jgi:diguanylate cyclase (GGDEF)-like protein
MPQRSITNGNPLLAVSTIANASEIHVSPEPSLNKEMTPVQMAIPPQRPNQPTRPVQHALEHALSITLATTDDDLIARTLEAACDLTGAPAACAVEPDGRQYTYGEQCLAGRLLGASVACGLGSVRPGSQTRVFTTVGLPSALTAGFGGTLIVVASPAQDAFDTEAASLLALVVAHAQAGRDRLRELAVLARRANSDPLTGLRHYRPFEERLAASVPNRTAIITIDIDDFKRINDEQGHQAGDNALVALVAALRGALRGDDHIYRIGGDEFAVVIDVNGATEASIITRRLLEAARLVGHTISVGAAMRMPDETGRETLRRADSALYQAKRDGRDTARIAA